MMRIALILKYIAILIMISMVSGTEENSVMLVPFQITLLLYMLFLIAEIMFSCKDLNEDQEETMSIKIVIYSMLI